MAEALTDNGAGHYYPPADEVDLAWSPQGRETEPEPAVPHYVPPASEADIAWSPCSDTPAQKTAGAGAGELTSRRFNRYSGTERALGTSGLHGAELPHGKTPEDN